jgi:hypothetical protein
MKIKASSKASPRVLKTCFCQPGQVTLFSASAKPAFSLYQVTEVFKSLQEAGNIFSLPTNSFPD